MHNLARPGKSNNRVARGGKPPGPRAAAADNVATGICWSAPTTRPSSSLAITSLIRENFWHPSHRRNSHRSAFRATFQLSILRVHCRSGATSSNGRRFCSSRSATLKIAREKDRPPETEFVDASENFSTTGDMICFPAVQTS